MAGGGAAVIGAAALRRQQMTGKKGISALLENKRAIGIALFASYVQPYLVSVSVSSSQLLTLS